MYITLREPRITATEPNERFATHNDFAIFMKQLFAAIAEAFGFSSVADRTLQGRLEEL